MKLVAAFVLFFSLVLGLVHSDCTDPQPLVDSLPATSFSASLTSADSGHTAAEARLSTGDAWCSMEINDLNLSPYIQAVFDSLVIIESVRVGGHTDVILFFPFTISEYIVNYHIVYRDAGGVEQFVTDMNDNPQIFARQRNVDVQTVVLDTPITTDLIQIKALPGSWMSNNDRVCIRFEANGCLAPVITQSSATSSPSSASSSYLIQSSIAQTLTSFVTSSLPQESSYLASFVDNSSFAKTSTVVSVYSSSFFANIIDSSISSIDNSFSPFASPNANSGIISSSSITGPLANANNQDNVTIYAASSSAIGVFLLVVVGIVIVVTVLCVILSHRGKKEVAHHHLDNSFYGYSMDDIASGESKVELANGDTNNTHAPGNIYDSIYTDKETLDDPKLELKQLPSELQSTGQVGGVSPAVYETMDSALTEKYDYVQRSDITSKPAGMPPLPRPREATPPLDGRGNTNLDDIVTSPNPTYNGNTMDSSRGGNTFGSPPPYPGSDVLNTDEKSDILNPLYGSDEKSDVLNPLYGGDEKSDVLNPLYGGGREMPANLVVKENDAEVVLNAEDMLDNPLYGGGKGEET